MPLMTRTYPLKLEPDNNTVVVTCSDLPDFVAYGKSEADGVRRAQNVIQAIAKLRAESGLAMPKGRRLPPTQPATTVTIKV